jgi:hypothetical protein
MSGLRNILSRADNADDISDKPAWKIGISMMASYATGVSLMAGMGLVFTMGLIPGFTWLFLNGISLGIWGVILTKYPHVKSWVLTLPWLLIAILFGLFGPAFNLTALKSLLVSNSGNVASYGVMSANVATGILVIAGLAVLLYINRYGIRGSVFTDFWQVCLQFGGVAGLIAAGWYLAGVNPGAIGFGDNIVLFAEGIGVEAALLSIWPTAISPFLMSMSWQRWQAAPESKRLTSALYGAGFFSLYMFMVGIAALVWQPHIIMTTMALLVVIGVGTSSLDSAISLHQYVGQRFGYTHKIGTALSGLALVIWAGAQTALPFGVADLWVFTASIMGPYFIAGMIVTTIWWAANRANPELTAAIRSTSKGILYFPENVYNQDETPTDTQSTVDSSPMSSDD